MATIFNMAGGGGAIHLSVVGGTTKPTSKLNRTVWIDTSTTSLTYVLSPTRPKTGVNGLVWIKTADTGAEVYVGNTIYHLYSAALYLNGKWDSVVGWVYTEKSDWVQFSKKLVPLEYTAVEYLESTGTQHIITDLVPTTTLWGFEIDWSCANVFSTDSNVDIFGLYISNNNYLLDWYTGGRFWYKNTNTGSMNKLSVNTRQQLKKHNTTMTFSDNSTREIPGDALTYADGIKLAIFGTTRSVSSSGVVTVKDKPKMKLYSFKFFDEHDELVGYFIPCYRNSDNMAGLWDQVREKFYTNQGTGTFLVGGDIT